MNGTALIKALQSTTDGAALVPYDLSPILYEELLDLSPLAALLSVEQAGGITHEFTKRTSHPRGWFEGEATPANAKNSVYARDFVSLKIQRLWGSVTGFAQAVDERFINALATELTGSVEGMANTLEFGMIWGCGSVSKAGSANFTGDPYQYHGAFASVMANAPDNVVDAGGNKIELIDLDAAIAKVNRFRGVGRDPKLWMMGLQMKQVVDGLQTKVSMPLTSSVLADGRYEMANYGGIPIYESDYVVPETSTTSPAAVAVVGGNATGAMAAATYKYQISSVTLYGEQVGGTVSADVVIDANVNTCANITWVADAEAVQYLIWKKTAAGAYLLYDIIPALTYDSAGTVNGAVAAYKDNGLRATVAVKPLASGEYNIFLLNTNPARGLSILGKIDDMGRPIDSLMSFVELARVKDTYDYMLKAYLAAKLVYPNMVSVIRHAKLS